MWERLWYAEGEKETVAFFIERRPSRERERERKAFL
jgi:hypothetical protein